MDNIAEGFGRASKLESINSYSTSKGEAEELKSQLYRAFDVCYIEDATFEELYAETNSIIKSLTNWINYLNRTEYRGQKFKGR